VQPSLQCFAEYAENVLAPCAVTTFVPLRCQV
jgi:hypothetical protein